MGRVRIRGFHTSVGAFVTSSGMVAFILVTFVLVTSGNIIVSTVSLSGGTYTCLTLPKSGVFRRDQSAHQTSSLSPTLPTIVRSSCSSLERSQRVDAFARRFQDQHTRITTKRYISNIICLVIFLPPPQVFPIEIGAHVDGVLSVVAGKNIGKFVF